MQRRRKKTKLLGVFLVFFGMFFYSRTVLAADGNTVRIIVNQQEKVFEEIPIVTEDDTVLAALEDFGKAINATVLWDGEGKSFAIGYGNTVYMAKTGEKAAIAAQSYDFKEWRTVMQAFPSLLSKEDKQILIPLQEVCAALGIKSRFDTVHQTLYLTCEESAEEPMTVNKIRNMDLVYYANEKGETRFDGDSDDLLEFYEQRSGGIDVLRMGVSDIWSGIRDIISNRTNAENVITDSLKSLMVALPDNDIVQLDIELLNTVKSAMDSGETLLKDNLNSMWDEVLEIEPELKALKEATDDLEGTYEIVSDMYDASVYLADVIVIFLSDYTKNISYLDILEDALYESGVEDETLLDCISFLRAEYTNKFAQAFFYSADKITQKAIGKGTDVLTGGLFSVGEFAWNTFFYLTGVKSKGEALKQFYGLFCINGPIDAAYKNQCKKVLRGEADCEELDKFKKLDDLQRALKAAAYESIRMITDDQATKEYCQIKEKEYIQGCMRWNKVLTIADPASVQNTAAISQLPGKFTFTSGAGAWRTDLSLNPDGTFTGKYVDSNSGDEPEEIFCNFKGKFSDLKQVDEYIYSMSVEYLNTINIPGEEYYRDGTRYISSTPYGLEDTQEVLVYFPGCSKEKIPQDIASWILSSYGLEIEEGIPEGAYILCDKSEIWPFIGRETGTTSISEF